MQTIFLPGFWIRHKFIQSFLASNHFGTIVRKNHNSKSTSGIIETNGVYLGYYANIPENPKGVIILIHGWEGSADSAYILKTTDYFLNQNYLMIRLNLRDHGGTPGLNLEPFNGSLLPETFEAVRFFSDKYKSLPIFLVGFSLGGNFVSRIAIRSSKPEYNIKNLKECFAISPAFHPENSTAKIDKNIILKKYFLNSWKSSLEEKSYYFPDFMKSDDFKNAGSVMKLTESLVLKFTEFKSLKEYFSCYTLTQNHFKDLKTPLTILSSRDDPIIDSDDFLGLQNIETVKVILTNYGGHNGFLPSLKGLKPYYVDVIEEGIQKSPV